PASAEAGPRIVAAPRRAPVMRSASRAVDVSAAAHAEASPSTGRRAVARPPTRTRADPRSQGPDHSVRALVHSAFNSTADLVQFGDRYRSEEHTSELQSRFELVCRLQLE